MRRFLYGFVMVLTQLPLAGSAAELHVIGAASSGGTTVIRATASGAARVRIHGVADQGGKTILTGEAIGVPRSAPHAKPSAEPRGTGGCCGGGKATLRSPSHPRPGIHHVTATTKVYQGGCNTGYARVHTTTRSCRGSCTGASSHVASSHVASSHFARNHVVGVRVASDAGVAQSESHAELLVSPRHSGARVIAIADSQVAQY